MAMNFVSPVTESEMRDWFARLSTMVVDASNQARQLETVQAQVTRLQDQLTQLSQDNTKLKAEVAETWTIAANIEKERDAARAEIARLVENTDNIVRRHSDETQDLENRLSQSHDALLQRDSRIAELEAKLAEAERNIAEKGRVVEDLTSQVRSTSDDRDFWRDRAQRLDQNVKDGQAAIQDLTTRYDRAVAQLNMVQVRLQEFRSMFEQQEPQAQGGSTPQAVGF